MGLGDFGVAISHVVEEGTAILTEFGAWLVSKPVQEILLLIFGALQILLLISNHYLRARMTSIELRHDSILQRTAANAGDLHRLKRDTTDKMEAMVKQTRRKR